MSALSNRSQRSIYNYARRPILHTGLRPVLLFLVQNQNGGRPPFGFCWISFSDHPRSLPDDPKLCLKFYVNLIYTFEDTAISIFKNLAQNAYLGPKNGVFGGFRPINVSGYHRDPQKALLCAKPLILTYRSSKLVNCGDLQAR